ncbi:polysaccharide deacetylase family protein [Bartonella tamiae]|uniref:Chitooligosaccharide deacetylase n=1 Tax=Bartonella tamiae Th239 TaxID=1094558 RepID=J0ZLS9_9HYPH|nr:polysaccharide deacetylase family protein [Bartonella tamiae]EJF89383.1 hypothetical protein ME5_01934 [Bartonella tamiae Th239]EJF92752.1 hypothetical protein MEG_01922 [Bartonella tamiae Th307]
MAVPILLYHHIGIPPKSGTPSRSNYVTIKNFEKQMRWLHRLGIRGLSLKEAIPYIYKQKKGKVAAITFDDGFLSVYDYAMPILNRFHFTATNFFVVNRLGLDNSWDDKKAQREKIMTVKQMRDWAAHGHEVGSHTLDHIHLTKIKTDQAYEQIVQSKIMLENILGHSIHSFAYPYGDENRELHKIVEKSAYDFAVTTQKGRAQGCEGYYELPRYSIRRNDTIFHFLAKVLWR